MQKQARSISLRLAENIMGTGVLKVWNKILPLKVQIINKNSPDKSMDRGYYQTKT